MALTNNVHHFVIPLLLYPLFSGHLLLPILSRSASGPKLDARVEVALIRKKLFVCCFVVDCFFFLFTHARGATSVRYPCQMPVLKGPSGR